MFRRLSLVLGVVIVAAGLAWSLLHPKPTAGAPTLPDGFVDTLVTSVPSPTALAFTPDGRILVASQQGLLRIVQSDALLPDPALDLSSTACANSARGLLGVAVDPDFVNTHFVYLFYTFKKFGVCDQSPPNNPVNRVSRFTLSDANTIDPASEVVLVDNIPSVNGGHEGGDLQFGRDGYLYISTGDGYCDYLGNSGCASDNDAARDQNVLLGKILRITADGGVPPSNPFMGPDSARCSGAGFTDPGKQCQETFAWGLRNPWRMAFDPNASETRFYINDVGQGAWDEIDDGQAGADYGWNVREGHCLNGSTTNCGPPPPGMTNPIYDYGHTGSCSSITGGAFVPAGVWPPEYNGAYLYADYVCGAIFQLMPAGGGFNSTQFMAGAGVNSIVAMRFGPYGGGQALYYTSYAGTFGITGELHRVTYAGAGNRPPTAAAAANPASGQAPLAVTFDASNSSDPDGDPLTYTWDFGDGSDATTGITTTHTFSAAGTFTPTLTVRDTSDAVATTTLRIDAGDTAPAPTIISPGASMRFAVGQVITLQGSATDAEDGPLPDSSLNWTVVLHHNEHLHPYLPPTTGNNITFTAPPPEDFASVPTSYLELRLAATDARGVTSTITQALRPNQVNVSFATQPPGLALQVNGTQITAPRTLPSWQGYVLNVEALAQTDASGALLYLATWSDGVISPTRAITTPATDITYSATFKQTTRPALVNAGFEFDANNDGAPDNWSRDTRATRANAVAYSGRYALRLAAADNASFSVYQNVANLQPGTPYDVGAWVNIPATGDTFMFSLFLQWRDANNVPISSSVFKIYTTATGGWSQAQATVTAPPGADHALFTLSATDLNAAIYVDDVFLRTGNLLLNPGFERDANRDGVPDDWTGDVRARRTNTVVHGGNYSVQLTAARNATIDITQSVPNIQPGQLYDVGAWVNIPATTDRFVLRMWVQWRNTGNSLISSSEIKIYSAPTNGWDQATASMMAPAGATTATVMITAYNLKATLYLDDVTFRIGNLLLNAGFEVDANADGALDYWSANPYASRTGSVVHSGSSALQLAAGDNASFTIYQLVSNLQPGASYQAAAWVNIPPTTDTFTFRFAVQWRDAADRIIGANIATSLSAATNGWTQANATLLAPPGTDHALVVISATDLNATIYVDDLVFR